MLSGDANYSWSELREACREDATRPLIKHKEHNGLKKGVSSGEIRRTHNARMNDEDYHRRWMSETGFSLLKKDDGEKLRSRTGTEVYRA